MNKKISILISGIMCLCMGIFSPYNINAETVPINQYLAEAEDCILEGCSAGNYGEGYSGEGYVEYINEIGDSVTGVFDIEAGLHTFQIQYSQGDNSTNTLSLYVNSEFVKKIEFPHTGDWDVSWANNVYVQLQDLPEGELTFELRYEEGDGNVDIDYILCSQSGIITDDLEIHGTYGGSRTIFTSFDGCFDYTYGRDPHPVARILSYKGSGEDVFIDNIMDGLRVTSVEIDFSGQDNLHSVTFGGSSTPFLCIAGSYADCQNLEELIVLPGLSDKWRENAWPVDRISPEECRTHVAASFENCVNLKKVSFPASFSDSIYLSEIGDYTFKNCSSLPEITLDGCWEIGEGAFVGCTALEKVVLTKDIASIGDHALGYIQNEDGSFCRYEGITIYGIAQTAAETYAIENDIPFVNIDVEGDANCDGELTISDLVLMKSYLVQKDVLTFNSQGMSNADYNGDGALNALDMVKMRRVLIDLLNE